MTPDQRMLLRQIKQRGVVGEWQPHHGGYIRWWILTPAEYTPLRHTHHCVSDNLLIAAKVYHERCVDDFSSWHYETALDCDSRNTELGAMIAADSCIPGDPLPEAYLPNGWLGWTEEYR